MRRRVIAVDWDGTLVEYDGYKGAGVFGPPIPLMLARVENWIDCGHEVIIFTSRVSEEWDVNTIVAESLAISETLKAMGLPDLEVTANKYARIDEFWDDKGVGVIKNKGKVRGTT